jgi:hypothetical protein
MDVSEAGQASVDQQPASIIPVQQPVSTIPILASILAFILPVQQPASTLAVPGPALTKADLAIWDSDFIKIDNTTLFRLISATNYLDVKGLLGLAVKEIASRLKGKTSEEMREILYPPSSSS